jgi:hypothetical protein
MIWCRKHAAEHAEWVQPSPDTFRSMGGRGGITLVQIGKMTAARFQQEHQAFVDRAYAGIREQCEMIKRFCEQGRNCSSDVADMWTANGDGVKDAPVVETMAGP